MQISPSLWACLKPAEILLKWLGTSVCPSVPMKQLENRWTDSHEILYWGISLNWTIHSSFSLIRANITDILHKRQYASLGVSRLQLVTYLQGRKMFRINVEKDNDTFYVRQNPTFSVSFELFIKIKQDSTMYNGLPNKANIINQLAVVFRTNGKITQTLCSR
jgi:hypothetical protein